MGKTTAKPDGANLRRTAAQQTLATCHPSSIEQQTSSTANTMQAMLETTPRNGSSGCAMHIASWSSLAIAKAAIQRQQATPSALHSNAIEACLQESRHGRRHRRALQGPLFSTTLARLRTMRQSGDDRQCRSHDHERTMNVSRRRGRPTTSLDASQPAACKLQTPAELSEDSRQPAS